MASQRKKDTLKVVSQECQEGGCTLGKGIFFCLFWFFNIQVHLPSQTVFCNWPVRRTPLGYVTAVDISPHSKYLAIGNAKGRVLLYRYLLPAFRHHKKTTAFPFPLV